MKTYLIGFLVLVSLSLSAQIQLVKTSPTYLYPYSDGFVRYDLANHQVVTYNNDLSDSSKYAFNLDYPTKYSVSVNYYSQLTFDSDPDFDLLIVGTDTSNTSQIKLYHQNGSVLYDFRSVIKQKSMTYGGIINNLLFIMVYQAGYTYYYFNIPGTIEHIIELPADKVIYYPNPATSLINIDVSPGGTIILFDFFGNIIRSEPFQSNSLDISSLLPGEYLFRITNGAKISSGRFVKL